MNRTDLLDTIGQKAGIEDRTDVARAAEATLRTLGEHVSEGQAQDIAAIVPAELGDAVTSHLDDNPDPEQFSPEEFAARIAEREGPAVHAEEAMRQARATMAAIADHGGQAELQDAREQLPTEFATVFETDDRHGE